MGDLIRKNLFRHGGSKAIDLPMSFVRRLKGDQVTIEIREDGLFIPSEETLDTIENEPLFETFVEAILQDALKNPDQLKDAHEIWDQEWIDLLEGVDDSD